MGPKGPMDYRSMDRTLFFESLVTFFKVPPCILMCEPLEISKIHHGAGVANHKKSFLGNSSHPLASSLGPMIPGWNGKCLTDDDGNVLIMGSTSSECSRAQRSHKSNHVFYLVNVEAMCWVQHCHDPDCKSAEPLKWMDLQEPYREIVQKYNEITNLSIFNSLFLK